MTPRAGRTAVTGVSGDALRVKLAAAPMDRAANDALIAFLSEIFQVPRRSVRVVTGERSRTKRVLFAGATPAVLDARLSTLLEQP